MAVVVVSAGMGMAPMTCTRWRRGWCGHMAHPRCRSSGFGDDHHGGPWRCWRAAPPAVAQAAYAAEKDAAHEPTCPSDSHALCAVHEIMV